MASWVRRARIQKEDRENHRSDRMLHERHDIYWLDDQCPWLAVRFHPPLYLSRSNEIAPRRLDQLTRSYRTARVRAFRAFLLALYLLHSHGTRKEPVHTVFLFFSSPLLIGVFTRQCQCVMTKGDMGMGLSWPAMKRAYTYTKWCGEILGR